MNEAGKNILIDLRRKWQLQMLFEILLYAIGPSLFLFVAGLYWVWCLGLFAVVILLIVWLKKPWQLTLSRLTNLIDKKVNSVEYSSGLLLLTKAELSSLAQLQSLKITESLEKSANQIIPRSGLRKSFLTAAAFVFAGFFLSWVGLVKDVGIDRNDKSGDDNIINFKPSDSVAKSIDPPKIEGQSLTINYPSYTGVKSKTTTDMNVKALEGSRLNWKISFDSPVDNVQLVSNSKVYSMKSDNVDYKLSMILKDPGFYSFRFMDKRGGIHVSDLYALETTRDRPSRVEIKGVEPFTSFEFSKPKKIELKALLNDDYGISDAQIVATVSKGSGESVKFREEKLSFDTGFSSGRKSVELSKEIDLDRIKMTPGDELYFYVEVTDTKRPRANISRSETFFAIIKDTVTDQFAVEGTMGADLMPDYFRSQRQLIIDTEKLIAQKSELSEHEFNSTSNELGFDQKALRLKYGEFMGDEADSGIQGGQPTLPEENDESDDPLEEYTHDHDGDNEHNLVDHDHDDDTKESEEEDPLHDYLHNHDDPEESTLFTQSLKGKLRQAMSEMWDAELHLRLFTPKKSLPYQYRALKLIQEIKNSARIYVHRIGFDPPPIKEDVRLTGEIDEVQNFQTTVEPERHDSNANMKSAVRVIENILFERREVSQTEKLIFDRAGNELAQIAIAEPGKYLRTLQHLKWLASGTEEEVQVLKEVQMGLMKAIPKAAPNPKTTNIYYEGLNDLFIEELQAHE